MNLNGTERTDPAFDETMDFLDGLISYGIKLGLDSTRNFLDLVGNPQHGMRFIHVAGTNGKGSVCALLSGALKACGLRVGLFSSPHLVSLRERLRVNGEPISEADFAALSTQMRKDGASVFSSEQGPTFFEFMTVLGFLFFRQQNCDVVVMEVGMGGRLDSTNVLDPMLSVITSIGMDHVEPLGGTLEAIAGEKAGIIKEGRPVIIDHQDPSVTAVLRGIAAERNAPLTEGGIDFNGISYETNPVTLQQGNMVRYQGDDRLLNTHLAGPHQLDNTALAWAVVNQLKNDLGLDLNAAAEGMSKIHWVSRMDLLPDGILLDAAHNPEAMRTIVGELQKLYPGKRWHLMFGCLSNKEWQEMLTTLAPICASAALVAFDHWRLEPPANLQSFLAEQAPDLPTVVCANAQAGLKRVRELGNGLILGSLYLAGEVLHGYYHGKPVPIEKP